MQQFAAHALVTRWRDVVFGTCRDFGLGDVEIVVTVLTRLFNEGFVHNPQPQ
jgi:hypothetical protein